MRNVISLFLLIGMAGGAAAQTADGPTICRGAAEYARSIMESRQAGVPEAELVKQADLVPAGSRNIALRIMITAYEQPRFDSEAEQDNAVAGFGEQIYAQCMESY